MGQVPVCGGGRGYCEQPDESRKDPGGDPTFFPDVEYDDETRTWAAHEYRTAEVAESENHYRWMMVGMAMDGANAYVFADSLSTSDGVPENLASANAAYERAGEALAEELITTYAKGSVTMRNPPAVVIGATSRVTGQSVVGASRTSGAGPRGCWTCAERDAMLQLGGNPSDIVFSNPVRPRTGQVIAPCTICQAKFGSEQWFGLFK